MKEIIPILKIGSSKGDFPPYCRYIKLYNNKIQACNGSEFVEIHKEHPFTGCINLYVLDDVLKNCSNPQLTQEDDVLRIEEGSYKTKIIIDDIEFPSLPNVKADMLEITEDLLTVLKTAIKFTGEGIKSYIYLCNDYITSTDGSRCFFHKQEFNVSDSLGINKKILAVLSKDCSIGVQDSNTVVTFGDSRVVFSTALLTNYPNKKVVDGVKMSKKKVQKLCNVATLQDAVQKVIPMLVGELSSFVELKNKDNKLTVQVESVVNGISSMVIGSEIDDEFNLDMQSAYLTNIDYDYDVFVNVKNVDRLYLTNSFSEIVLMGGD